jgi:hypothetical protein
MKVELELKNGRRKAFPAKLAKVLVARGLGSEVQGYQTRELRAAPASQPTEDEEVRRLRAELDKRDIKYHHRAGVAKLRELLEG